MAEEGSTSGPKPSQPDVVRPYGKYYLIRKLAEGGMAEIFLAKQVGAEGFERNVVIKRMLQHLSSVPDFVGMFLDEARLAARLGHPNIVQINDLGLADGCYYICMEYVPGEDLSTVLRTASRRHEYVPLDVVARLITEAAHGLHFAHEFTDESGKALNIVHRDISPSNIYCTYQGQAKLLDFGIAKAESRVTQTTAGVVKGKYMYMAPEQAGTGMVDRRADVFSLGVTLYESLTNTRPFARDTDLAILNAVLKGDYKPPRAVRADLPLELEQIVLKAMAQARESRYPTTHAMAVDLEHYLGSSTSASGGAKVSAYLRNLFGEARVMEKTRIPSLSGLGQAGADTSKRNTSSGVIRTPASQRTETNTAGSAARPGRRSRLPLLVTGFGGLVAGAGVLFALNAYQQQQRTVDPRPDPTQSGADAAILPPPPPVAADSGPGLALNPPAHDAGGPRPEPPPRPLNEELIQRQISRQSNRVIACLKEHHAELPSTTGQVPVIFVIDKAGKVSGAQLEGPLAGTPVGGCIARAVNQWTFPRNTNGPFRMRFPFGWQAPTP